MAEFPTLGEHCGYQDCSRLDFLPMRCDACKALFCCDHIMYDEHRCVSNYKKNVQVPVCPLCNQPVPVPRGQSPDSLVGMHIDRDCKSDPAKAKRGQIYKNRCTKIGCKKAELVPVICTSCGQNFCFAHRHAVDHDCQAGGKPMSNSAIAALSRLKIKDTKKQQEQAVTANDEALARALQESLNGPGRSNPPPVMSAEELDRRLAEQLQAEENGRLNGPARGAAANRRAQTSGNGGNNNCALS